MSLKKIKKKTKSEEIENANKNFVNELSKQK